MENSTVGFTYGDAEWHREQRCNQDCNQGRNCDCAKPDLVKRLRSRPRANAPTWAELMFEAADEIERLRQQRDELVAALKKIPEVSFWEDARAICYEALAKIEGGK